MIFCPGLNVSANPNHTPQAGKNIGGGAICNECGGFIPAKMVGMASWRIFKTAIGWGVGKVDSLEEIYYFRTLDEALGKLAGELGIHALESPAFKNKMQRLIETMAKRG